MISLLADLDRMSAITEQQWHSTDVRTQGKLSGRLTSLHRYLRFPLLSFRFLTYLRTLGRLQTVVRQPLKYTRMRDMFTKLEEHVEKMSHLSTGLRVESPHSTLLVYANQISTGSSHSCSTTKHLCLLPRKAGRHHAKAHLPPQPHPPYQQTS